MIDPEKIQTLRRNIAELARSEEEIHNVLQILQKTDWTNYRIPDSPPARCYRCSCVLTPLTDGGDDECLECTAFICALCKQPRLKDDHYGYTYRVICDTCLIRRNITKEWQRPEANRVSGHEIRAWKLGQIGDLPFRQWLTTLEDFNWHCAYCLKANYEVIEHFVPIIKGGDTIPANCVPSCKSCNSMKAGKHPNKLTCIPSEDLTRVRDYLSTRL